MTAKGFVELIDKEGNKISAPADRAEMLIKSGWRRKGDPPKKAKKPEPLPDPGH